MSPEDIGTRRPAAANLAQQPEMSLAAVVERSIADPNKDGMEIVDEFVGSLVAEGGVTTSEGHHLTPQKVLADMEYSVTAMIRGDEKNRSLRLFTRNNGLRNAVQSLIHDERSANYVQSARGALSHTGEGLALTSPVQVKSYLQTLARKNGESEDAPWVANITHMYENSGAQIPTDVKSVFAIRSAFRSAEAAGADIDMLRRSVESKRSPGPAAKDVGSVALAPSLDVRLNRVEIKDDKATEERNRMLDSVLDPNGTLPKVKLHERAKTRLAVNIEGADNVKSLDPLPGVYTKSFNIVSPEGQIVGTLAIGVPEHTYMGSRDNFIRDMKVYDQHRHNGYELATYLNILKALPLGKGLRTEGLPSPDEIKIWEDLTSKGLASPSNKGGVLTSFETTSWAKN